MTENKNDTQFSRRNFVLTTGAACSTAALAGCGSTVSEDDESSSDGDRDVLQLAAPKLESLDPVNRVGSFTASRQLYESLFRYPNGEIPPEPNLATDLSVSDDYRTYTISLKEGVTFHNGDELTADDVVYSFERVAQSEHSHHSSKVVGNNMTIVHERDDDGNYVPGSLAIEALDDRTVRFELDAAFNGTKSVLAHRSLSIVPEGIVGDVEGYDGRMDYEEFANESSVGTGPFALEEWSKGDHVSVETFEDYHGKTPDIAGIRWQILRDANTRWERAMNGRIDAFRLPITKFDRSKRTLEESPTDDKQLGTYGPVRNDETLEYGSVTSLWTFHVLFNTERVEPAARRALAYAINQESLVDDAFKGVHSPAYHMTPPPLYEGGKEGYDQHAQQYPYGYNETKLEAARAELADAGYTDDDPYEMTFTVYSEQAGWLDLAQNIRDKVRSANIDLTVERAPGSTITNQAVKGNLDAFSIAVSPQWMDGGSMLRFLGASVMGTPSFSRWGQGDDEPSEAVEEARAAWQKYQENTHPADSSAAARNEAIVAFEEAVWKDAPLVTFYHEVDQRCWYDHVDLPMFGPFGRNHKQFLDAGFTSDGE